MEENRRLAEQRDVCIRIRDAIKIYKAGPLEVVALRGLEMEVARGEFVAVMGPSGCGKTTLLNLIGGMDSPSAGSVHVENTDLSQLDADQISDFRARKIGFVFQFFNLIPELTAAENVDLPMRIAGLAAKERERRTVQLLGQVGLSDRAAHRPGEVSGGEQQRVAIAVALANDPPVILADEPTGELDTESGAKVLGLLRELAKTQGKTVVVATHDMRIVRYADRVLRIMDGRILREEELESAAGQMNISESEELERLRKRVAELSDTLARIRESFASAEH